MADTKGTCDVGTRALKAPKRNALPDWTYRHPAHGLAPPLSSQGMRARVVRFRKATKGVFQERASVKGIMFNVLQEMADAGDCSNDAWELVIEFAAAESLLEYVSCSRALVRSEASRRLSYDAPAEAMVRCLSQDEAAAPRPAQGVRPVSPAKLCPDSDSDWRTDVLVQTPAFGSGFATEAFLAPDALLHIWEQDLDAGEDESPIRDDWALPFSKKTIPELN